MVVLMVDRVESSDLSEVTYTAYWMPGDSTQVDFLKNKGVFAFARAELDGEIYVLSHSHMRPKDLEHLSSSKNIVHLIRFYNGSPFGIAHDFEDADERVRKDLEYSIKEREGRRKNVEIRWSNRAKRTAN